jgi:hypothetical protein
MEQRFAVLAEGATPKIYKVPVNKSARLINEFPFQHVEIFKTLNDAKIAALGFARNAQPNQNSKISISEGIHEAGCRRHAGAERRVSRL